jgi:hypothetical protein
MGHVVAAAARLDAAQRAAVAAWDQYAGQLGGLLKGVADLTVDGRAPDVSNFLERLSKKVVRDDAFSTPLHVLAVEVGTWLDLVEHCGELLADGGVLAKAYRARRIRRALAALAAVTVAAAVLVVFLFQRAARARVDAVLSDADPCAAFEIAPADLARASSDQVQRAADRRAACDDLHRREAEAREAEQRRLAQAAAAAQARKDREARCDALAGRLADGAILPDDAALAPGKGPLLDRIARHALDREDMAEAGLPCGDTAAGPKIAAAFSAAVLASPSAWANADAYSDPVFALLVEHAATLPASPRQQLQVHADDLVRRAIIEKTPEATARAERVCKLKDDMGVRGSKYCPGLPALKAQGKL